jgi:hypothetical protein
MLLFLNGHFHGSAFDDRLRRLAGVVNRRLLFGGHLRLARLTFLPLAAVRTLTTLLARFVPLSTLLAFGLLRALDLFGLLLRCNDAFIAVIHIHIVAIGTAIFAAIVALEAFLHLGLSRSDDAVIMFSVLQIVLSDHAVAGTLRVARQSRVFFRYVLGCATDFNIGAGAVISPGERVAALAVEVVVVTATIVIVVASTPPAALVLLSWPHQLLT